MIDYMNVKVSEQKGDTLNFAAVGKEEVLQNVKIIITTPIETVPFDREFGIDIHFLDKPMPVAQGLLRMQYAEKVSLYEPRASIKEIQFETNSQTGTLIPKVVIDIDLEAE